MGPWSLAYHCFGVEMFLLLSLDDPGKTKLILDRLKKATIDFGVAQIEAGADALTLPDHATGDLVSGEWYSRYLRDLHQEFAEELPVPLIMHICGKTLDRMPAIAETGFAAFHYDSKNNPAEAMDSCATASPWSATSTTRRRCSRAARKRCAPRCSRTSMPACR